MSRPSTSAMSSVPSTAPDFPSNPHLASPHISVSTTAPRMCAGFTLSVLEHYFDEMRASV